MNNTQLLCTFCAEENLNEVLQKITTAYEVAFESIYVLENVDNPGSVCCTYNVYNGNDVQGDIPESTISLHRKKSTNTLYTINALNLLVAELNGGMVDKNYKVPWENYKNTILVTAYGKLKKIPTRLQKIVKVDELNAE